MGWSAAPGACAGISLAPFHPEYQMREVRRYTETAGTAVASEAAATFAAGARSPGGGIESANGTLMETKDIELVHNQAAQRFEAHVGGQTAFLTYRRFPDRFVLVHTEVPPALEDQGIAGKLVAA